MAYPCLSTLENYRNCPISIIQIAQNMIECHFCHSASQDSYIYTECSHLICLPCASLKWDRKYSLKCCNTTTFLQEETCFALEKINQLDERPPKDASKENIPSTSFAERTQPVTIKITKQDPMKTRDVQPSIYISQFQPKLERQQQGLNDRKNEACLVEMERIMSQSVQSIKLSFEVYRKEVERREQALLKEVYSRFSDQFTKFTITDEDTRKFKEWVNRMITDEMANLPKAVTNFNEPLQDKIIQRLEYNMQKMNTRMKRDK